MNAAARLVTSRIDCSPLAVNLRLSLQQWMAVVISLLLVASGLSIIYLTNFNRVLHSAYQRHMNEYDQLRIEHGQLLLERSSWLTQSRVQHIAEDKLDMVIPDHSSIVVLRDK